MAPLDRALTFTQVEHVTVAVGDHLDLDVSRSRQPALGEHGVVTERGEGLAPSRGDRILEVVLGEHEPHASAAAARRGLDQQGIADGGHLGPPLERRVTLELGARQERHAHLGRDPLRRELVAHTGDGVGVRTDPRQPGVDNGSREVGVLGQEAVPRMHGVGPGALGGAEQLGDVEVRLGCRVCPERDRDIGAPDVSRCPVCLAVHRDRAHAHVVSAVDARGRRSRLGWRRARSGGVPRLHPEDAEAIGAFDRPGMSGRERDAEDGARVAWIDDAVVPQSTRGEQRRRLAFDLVLDGICRMAASLVSS